ncbi:MAG: xanthine dehydrogenase family protein molybdopterin-binding subunit, partial [Cellulosilyticaceae bacterium]
YLTGMAVVKTCDELRNKMLGAVANILEVNKEELTFDGVKFESLDGDKVLTLDELAQKQVVGDESPYLVASQSHSSPTSPPPFMVGFVETEVDTQTGQVEVIDYVGVVDCGTVINTNLARIQTEGGIVQGIGMALYEEVSYAQNGKMMNNSFMQYKIPTRLDVGNVRVAFESSYEPTGPFGAKSIGEVVINTPPPALAHAVYNATKVHVRTLPITPEKVVMGMIKGEN